MQLRKNDDMLLNLVQSILGATCSDVQFWKKPEPLYVFNVIFEKFNVDGISLSVFVVTVTIYPFINFKSALIPFK